MMVVLNYILVLFLLLVMRTEQRVISKEEALNFLHQMQSGQSCSGNATYTVIDMNGYGGFASQFQQVAAEWIRAAAHHDYKIPVLLTGHIRGYSDVKYCDHVNHEWTCYFLPLSNCHTELMKSGNKVAYEFKTVDDSVVPAKFSHMGIAWWWGIVHLYIFRLQPYVETYIKSVAKNMDNGGIFYTPRTIEPLVGIHVRHGDKASDGFKEHSLKAEMVAAKHSSECHLYDKISSSFIKVGDKYDITDDNIVCSYTNSSHAFRPLKVFVASDDPAVLDTAKKLGHLVDTAGVSQQTSNVGMMQTLSNRNSGIGFNASLEIIADIFFLSQSSTLVGIAASQVFRMAVDMSNSSGILKHAIIMDYNQLPRIQQLSIKYHVPLPEVFEHF